MLPTPDSRLLYLFAMPNVVADNLCQHYGLVASPGEFT